MDKIKIVCYTGEFEVSNRICSFFTVNYPYIGKVHGHRIDAVSSERHTLLSLLRLLLTNTTAITDRHVIIYTRTPLNIPYRSAHMPELIHRLVAARNKVVKYVGKLSIVQGEPPIPQIINRSLT